MEDPRSFATNVVGVAIAILGVGLLVAAAVLAFGGSIFLGVIVGGFGLVVLLGAGAFLLVPSKLDDLEEEHAVRLKPP